MPLPALVPGVSAPESELRCPPGEGAARASRGIGAARFLRGQRLTGALLNCYVPVASKFTIGAQSALPLLLPSDERPDQAAVRRWLTFAQGSFCTGAAWSGLAYQTLLTQGQQSLSVESGLLDCRCIVSL